MRSRGSSIVEPLLFFDGQSAGGKANEMRIAVATIFPAFFHAYLGDSIVGRAVKSGILQAEVYDIRDYAADRHRTVDDAPYGGGPGMVMKAEPAARALDHVLSDGAPTRIIMPTPAGQPLSHALALGLAAEGRRLLFLAGRYEGIDDRVRQTYGPDEISIGDYVLTGGELPALVIIDALVRLLPGVLGDERSLREESFSWGILDYPHYTRPPEWRGLRVPEVLMSGNHREIDAYRRKEALRLTLARRRDLLRGAALSESDRAAIAELQEEEDGFRKGG